MNFEVIIGIEIHLELLTNSKMFSTGKVSYKEGENTNLSAYDLALPGTMPLVNKKAVEQAIKVAHILNCQIDDLLVFDRKNYFYSDLPKGFQITQDKRPIGSKGYLEIATSKGKKIIPIERLHIEEDTAKQLHFDGYSLIDYTRSGSPLAEIVTGPDFRSSEEVASYLDTIRMLVEYIDASDAKMEEGSLRCDLNISLRPFGSEKFGTKVEVKNMNSVSNVIKAIDFEISRQSAILYSGGIVEQETRRYDDTKKETIFMRKKSNAVDYKYFTESNITPIRLDKKWIAEITSSIGELPNQKIERFVKLGLNEKESLVVITNKSLNKFYDEVIKNTEFMKQAMNLLIGEVSAYLNKNNFKLEETKLTPKLLAQLATSLGEGKTSSKHTKLIVEEMLSQGKDLNIILKENNLVQISDVKVLQEFVDKVIAENPAAINDIKNGKDNAYQFLMAQVMKLTRGQASPSLTMELIKKSV